MKSVDQTTTGAGTSSGAVTNGESLGETRGLCLLSLDGGGVRGLSTLYILRGIMNRLNDEREKQDLGRVKPCEIFDLIGGTSTGGLIAIMLGRLEMEVEECITEYKTLMRIVFAKKEESRIPMLLNGLINPRFSSEVLAKAIKSVVQRAKIGDKHVSGDEPFHSKSQDRGSRSCRVFVCAQRRETGNITRLRSYHVTGAHPCEATIWEAALATSAAPGFFEPVKIGDCMYGDGGLGANNPAEEVESEAVRIWCEMDSTLRLQSQVKCFLSLGTGDAGINPISDKAWKFLTKSLVKIVTETGSTAEAVARRWRNTDSRLYFRFNVQQGLQEVGLAEWQNIGRLISATERYLDGEDTSPRVISCVEILRTKEFGLEPNSAEHRTLQAIQRRRLQQAPETMSKAEMIELTRKGQAYLRECATGDASLYLIKARDTFLNILRAQQAQHPAAQAKELCHSHNKLRYTSHQLSQLDYDAGERMKLIDFAAKHGERAIQCAIDSQNDHRVAQMRFYHACVLARKVQLATEEQRFQTPTQQERHHARNALEEAWTMLRSTDGSDMALYEPLKARSLNQLLARS